ncbi:DUF5047 domain-containing protein [Streptomyces sp. NPDC048196]|uniref:DUF5047 domain-containing protein n=1 Tax=Streptomyces sp. NPDC048196 TaxID=3154712 RepID=UPI0033F371A5
MYPISDQALSLLSESHRVLSEVELHTTDGRVQLLDHISGSVTADRGSACRRTCSVVIPDPALIPRTELDRISVYGAYVVLRRGIDLGSGQREMIPLGQFRIDDIGGDIHAGPVTLNGKSFEAYLSDDKFTAPTSTRGYSMVSTAISYLVSSSMPSLVMDTTRLVDTACGVTTWDIEGDRLEAIREVARAAGCEAYCNADGTLVVAPLPDPLLTTPVWEIRTGDRGNMIKAERSMSSQGVYNGVSARGENTESDSGPVSALVVDDDPSSPTYWGGPFGHRPKFISSSTLTTTGACTAAATYELAASRRPNATADLSALPNPALEPGDVIRAVYKDGTRELHQVQSLTISLEPGGEFSLSLIGSKEDA